MPTRHPESYEVDKSLSPYFSITIFENAVK